FPLDGSGFVYELPFFAKITREVQEPFHPLLGFVLPKELIDFCGPLLDVVGLGATYQSANAGIILFELFSGLDVDEVEWPYQSRPLTIFSKQRNQPAALILRIVFEDC